MKKIVYYYCFLFVFAISGLCFVNHLEQKVKRQEEVKTADIVIMQPMFENVHYYNFLKNIIPEHHHKFVEPFYVLTKDNKEIGVELLAIAQNESGWKIFRSPKNLNGTRDYGPLMLNSIHLDTDWFRNIKKEYEDINVAYMVGGIKIYQDLRTRHSPWDSFRMYNGGERGGLRKQATLVYAEKVSALHKIYSKEWNLFKIESKKGLQSNYITYHNDENIVSMQPFHPKQSTDKFRIKYNIIPYIRKIRIKILSQKLYYLA